MRRVCFVVMVAILPIAVAAVPTPRGQAAEPAALKIGMPENMFSGLPAAVVQIGAQPFKDMFEKQTGLKGEVALAKDYLDETEKLRAGKLDIAVFHGYEYAWVRHHSELVPLLIAVPGSKIRACLVVNTKCKATGPEGLRGDCVAIPHATKAHCHLYLERLKERLPVETCGTAKLEGKSIEDVLDAVATGNCEAALVDGATLGGYQRNKPGVGRQLKILAESEPFPAAVIVYRQTVFNAKTEKSLRDGLIQSIKTPQGELLKGLWKLEGFSEVGQAYQADLDRCLKSYPAPKPK